MDVEGRAKLEQDIRERADAAAFDEAVTIALRGYGPELFGYLIAIAKSEIDAADAFSQLCEDAWRGLPRFRWASSFRTWAYTLARNAHSRITRDPERRRPKVALSNAPELAELAVAVRTTTMQHQRTTVKSRIAQLRDQLEPDDRTLLVLRVDRQMSWREIAVVMAEDGEPSEADRSRVVVTLRKRFVRAKQRLHKLAAAQDPPVTSGED
jgi:RNA polymerase sigma-70 factor, ECF subfamily